MKLPGSAVLEFVVSDDGAGSRLILNARYHPSGVPGLLYWYALAPIHSRMFRGLADAIVARASAAANAGARP
jgi:hypothetical protein